MIIPKIPKTFELSNLAIGILKHLFDTGFNWIVDSPRGVRVFREYPENGNARGQTIAAIGSIFGLYGEYEPLLIEDLISAAESQENDFDTRQDAVLYNKDILPNGFARRPSPA